MRKSSFLFSWQKVQILASLCAFPEAAPMVSGAREDKKNETKWS